MNRTVIITVVLVVLGAGVLLYFARPEYQRIMTQTERALDMVERLENIISGNNKELLKQLEASDKALEAFVEKTTEELVQLAEINAALEKKIQPVVIPDFPVIPGCEEVAEAYQRVIVEQQTQIQALTSINTHQGLIITEQQKIIDKQGEHIRLMQEAQKDIVAKATRRALIGVAVGIIIGLIL